MNSRETKQPQIPVTHCAWCGSYDLGIGWQQDVYKRQRPHSAVDVLFQFWDNTLECPFHSTGAVVVHPDGQPMERHALLLRMADLQQNQMVLNKKS